MKRALIVLGVTAAFLPLLFTGLLLLAIQWPRMDTMTEQMPDSIRTTVAATLADRAGWGKEARPKLARVLRLDPDNVATWQKLCSASIYPDAEKGALEPCRRAAALEETSSNLYNRGKAEEANGEECEAAATYMRASQRNSTGRGYDYLEAMGRASLRCGNDPYLALAGLQGALDLQANDLKDGDLDDDEAEDERNDQATDRKYLVALEDHLRDPKAKAAACAAVDPSWKDCSCVVKADGTAACTGN